MGLEHVEKEGRPELGSTVDHGTSRFSEGARRGETSRQSRRNIPEEELVGFRVRRGPQVDGSYQTRPTRQGQAPHPNFEAATVLEKNVHTTELCSTCPSLEIGGKEPEGMKQEEIDLSLQSLPQRRRDVQKIFQGLELTRR